MLLRALYDQFTKIPYKGLWGSAVTTVGIIANNQEQYNDIYHRYGCTQGMVADVTEEYLRKVKAIREQYKRWYYFIVIGNQLPFVRDYFSIENALEVATDCYRKELNGCIRQLLILKREAQSISFTHAHYPFSISGIQLHFPTEIEKTLATIPEVVAGFTKNPLTGKWSNNVQQDKKLSKKIKEERSFYKDTKRSYCSSFREAMSDVIQATLSEISEEQAAVYRQDIHWLAKHSMDDTSLENLRLNASSTKVIINQFARAMQQGMQGERELILTREVQTIPDVISGNDSDPTFAAVQVLTQQKLNTKDKEIKNNMPCEDNDQIKLWNLTI